MNFKRIISYIDIRRQVLIFLIAVISTLFGAATPILYGEIVDNILLDRNLQMFSWFMLLYLLIIIAEIGSSYIQNCIVLKVGEEIALKLRRQIYKKFYQLDYNSKNQYGVGNIVSLYNSDIFQVTNMISRFVYDIILQVITLIIIVMVMFAMNVKLAVSAIVLIPIYVMIFIYLGNRTQTIAHDRQHTYVEINSSLQEDIKGSSFLRIKECISFRKNRMDSLFGVFFKINYKFSKLSNFVGQLGTFLASLADVIVLAFGGYMFIKGEITIGIIITLEAYTTHLFNPLLSLVSLNQITHIAKPSLERIFGFLDLPSSLDKIDGNVNLKEEISSIRVENISFSYEDKCVLNKLNLTIEPNTFHFIVGESGCGKSTLCTLLAKMLPVTEGKIYVNGHNIEVYSNESITEHIYYLPQESIVYNGTIRENIEMGVKYKDEEIMKVLKFVCLDKLGDEPINLNMHIVSEGDSLSGGEKRRLVLARALIRNFKVFILDEPTSGLDIIMRKRLITNLKELSRKKTIIVISHNVSEMSLADKISVIAEGKVSITGDIDTLKANADFCRMIENMDVNEL